MNGPDAIPARRSLLRRRLQRLWALRIRPLGWMGATGAALLAVAGWLSLFEIPAAQQRLATAQSDTAVRLRQRAETAAVEAGRPRPADQLAAFYRFFPADGSLRPSLETVYALARREGLQLDAGEYRVSKEAPGRLTQHEVMLPLRGSYPQIRRFLDAVLTSIPSAALQHVQFERKSVGDAMVSARVRLLLFIGPRS